MPQRRLGAAAVRAVRLLIVQRSSDVAGDAGVRRSPDKSERDRFPRMAFWPAEVEWHERDVVVPAFRRWLEAQGWETETESGFVDVVARRGDETIYAEVKGRTKSRPGAGLDTLYGQLLRRMPVEDVCPNTRFAVVIPTGAEAAALRVPRRVRELLRIDIYVVSDDGQVEKLSDSEVLEVSTRLGSPPRGPSPRPVARRPPRRTGSPGRTRRSSSTCCARPRSRIALTRTSRACRARSAPTSCGGSTGDGPREHCGLPAISP